MTIPRQMTGRCASGAERDRGKLWHAVSGEIGLGGGWQKALCGAEPGRRSNGWAQYEGDAVTCPRCLKHMSTAALKENPTPKGRAVW